MSLAAVMSGGTKCEPAETLFPVAANPALTSNSTARINFEFRLIHPSFAATMITFRFCLTFLRLSGARLSSQSESRCPALGAYPRLSWKGSQRIQNVRRQRLQNIFDLQIVVKAAASRANSNAR